MVQKSCLHQWRLVVFSHYLQGFMNPRWCRIFVISSISGWWNIVTNQPDYMYVVVHQEYVSFTRKDCQTLWITVTTQSFHEIFLPKTLGRSFNVTNPKTTWRKSSWRSLAFWSSTDCLTMSSLSTLVDLTIRSWLVCKTTPPTTPATWNKNCSSNDRVAEWYDMIRNGINDERH